MRTSYLYLLPITFLMCLQTVYAQVLSIDSIIHYIDRNHPMLAEFDAREKSWEVMAGSTTSWMAPMIGLGTFMTPYPGQEVMDRERGSWMISLEQSITNPAKQNTNRNYLMAQRNVERINRQNQFIRLKAEARDHYYQWYALEEKAKVLRETKKIVAWMIRIERLRYASNQGKLAAIYKAESRLHEVDNMLLMVEGEIDQRRYALQGLLNHSDAHSIMIDTTRALSVLPFPPADTSRLRQRSDVRLIEQNIESMRLGQAMQQAQAKPDFRLRFDHMQPIGTMPAQFSAMAMVSIPIAPWSSRMYKGEVRSMQHSIAGMTEAKRGKLLELRGMIMGMHAQLTRMQRQLMNYEQHIIPALQKNYDATITAYEENRETLSMVIDAWEALRMAKIDYIDKKSDYYSMMISYEKELEL